MTAGSGMYMPDFGMHGLLICANVSDRSSSCSNKVLGDTRCWQNYFVMDPKPYAWVTENKKSGLKITVVFTKFMVGYC